MSYLGKAFWVYFVSIALFLLVILILAANDAGGIVGAMFLMYPGLIVSMASGLFGATFSMLVNTTKRSAEGTLESLSAALSWHTLTVRGAVGVGAAAILYFFFSSGLLAGSLWPALTELRFEETQNGKFWVPNKDWSLLIIWSFIAGFSESFVPNILKKTESKGASS